MTKLAAALIVVIAFFSLSSSASAAPPADECPSIVPSANLKDLVGEDVTVYTVFRGTEIESFSAEVAGIGENQLLPGSSIVWAIASGPKIDAIDGVAQGMSGSPVYTASGELVGALAYGPTPNARIFGITPAAEMTKMLNPSLLGQLSGRVPNTIQTPYGKMKPLSTGISTSATGPFAELLKQKLQKIGISLQTGSKMSPSMSSAPGAGWSQGGSIFAMIATGRFSTGALGTVTYSCDDDILAFGHPNFGVPSSRAILTGGYIYDVVKSGGLWPAFKMGSPTDVAGALTADTRFGIAGKTGQTTPTSTISGTVGNYSGPISEIVKIPNNGRDKLAFITPELFAIALDQEIASNTIYDNENISPYGSYEISGRTASGPFKVTKGASAWTGPSRSIDPNFGSVLGGPPFSLINDIGQLVDYGLLKPSIGMEINSVKVNIGIKPGTQKYTITDFKVRVNRGKWISGQKLDAQKSLKKGQVLSVKINLLSASGSKSSRVIRYRVQKPKGGLSLENYSGGIGMQGDFFIIPEMQKPKDLKSIFESIKKPEGTVLTEKARGLKRISGSLRFDRVTEGSASFYFSPKKKSKNKPETKCDKNGVCSSSL